MQKIILTSILVLFIKLNAVSQVDTLKWINKNAHVLSSDIRTDQSEFSFLKKELKGKDIVGLGEGSHGTHEFYVYKERIISYLVKNCGFRLVAFEVPDSMMNHINSYVQHGQGDLTKAVQGLGLYGTEEIRELFLNLRDYNRNKPADQKVRVTGFDKTDYWADPISRDGFMAENVAKMLTEKNRKIILWAHNVHILKDTTAQYLTLGGHLRKKFDDRYFALALDTYQ